MRRPTAILCSCVVFATAVAAETASAHGGGTQDLRIRVLEVTPREAPIRARADGERLVVENDGVDDLRLCEQDDEPGSCTGRTVRAGDTVRIDDDRLHWVGGGETLPPGVDTGDSSPQKVYDVELDYRQGGVPGTITVRLEYVGGRSWLERYGEYGLLVAAVLVMLVVFFLDARRRRAFSAAASGLDEDAAADTDAASDER